MYMVDLNEFPQRDPVQDGTILIDKCSCVIGLSAYDVKLFTAHGR